MSLPRYRASGLVVMTSRLQRGDRLFNSGLAHIKSKMIEMTEKILFSLDQCIKCNQIKQLLKDRDDITVITFPHEIYNWSSEYRSTAEKYNVIDDLQRTAPVLLVDDKKYFGYLRIRKWLYDNP